MKSLDASLVCGLRCTRLHVVAPLMDVGRHSEILHTLIALCIVSGASVIGSISFALGRRLQAALPYLVGAAAGALLATAVTHMLPEAMERVGAGNRLSLLLIIGFLISFFLERLLWILFRKGGSNGHVGHVHLDSESFHHDHERDRHSKMGLVGNILFGGAVHSFMDGIAIATSFLIGHNIGVATTIAVLLHEVPHHVADVGVLVYSGLTRSRAVGLNLLATFGCALGGVLVLVFGGRVNLANNLLPIAAANFLYIAIGILLPELQREKSGRRSAMQVACLVLALLLIGAMSSLTSEKEISRIFISTTLAHLMK
jgi:zinc and cadmium transporter